MSTSLILIVAAAGRGAPMGLNAQRSLPAASSRSADAQAHLEKARKALEARDFAQMRTEVNRALRSDPQSGEAYLMLGTIDLETGDVTRAVRDDRRALELEPRSFAAHYSLALAYLRTRNVQGGLRELEQAVKLDPHSADAAYNLGVVLLELQKPSEAVVRLRQAKALGPERPDVVFNLVRAELAAHRPDEAREVATQASSSFSADAEWQGSVGRLFLDRGQPREAIAYLQAALRLEPQNADLRRALASGYVRSDQPEAALELLREPATAEDHYLRASAYYQLRHTQEASQEVEESFQEHPAEPRYLLLAARIQQRLGNQARALELLQRTIGLAPQLHDPYYSQAVSYYFEHRYIDARQSLNRALRLDPRSARGLFLYAVTLANEGKDLEAERYLRRAIACDPENARFEYHLGATLLRLNRPTEAKRAFEKSIRLTPDYSLPHYELGKLLAQNQPQDAARELQKAIQYQPNLVQAYYRLARVYRQLGEAGRSSEALAKFNSLKAQEATEERQLADDVAKELQ